MNKSNYRVCELFNGRFVIEKEVTKTITNGYLWWKSESVIKEFKEIGSCGKIAVCVDGYQFIKAKTYKTLDKASSRISKLRKGNRIFLFPSE